MTPIPTEVHKKSMIIHFIIFAVFLSFVYRDYHIYARIQVYDYIFVSWFLFMSIIRVKGYIKAKRREKHEI